MRSPLARLNQGIYRSPEAQREHLLAIRNMQHEIGNSFEHDHLYSCLSILDVKSTSLLTYNSILFAASSITLANFEKKITVGSILVFTALVLGALASALCLHVIWVYWTDTRDFESNEAIYYNLLAVRNARTISYRLSWVISQTSMVLLIVGVLVQRRFAA